MKKLFILLTLVLLGFTGYAQLTSSSLGNNAVKMKTTLTSSVDSVVVTNTGTGDLVLGFTTKEPWSIQVLITKASGTLGGTMTLYGSNDGVTYAALTDATSAPTITTHTVTDAGTYAAPQTKLWYLGAHQMKYYKVTWAGTGTMVGRFKAIVKY
jgi:hypothetical protein